jgi:hypothetical protein
MREKDSLDISQTKCSSRYTALGIVEDVGLLYVRMVISCECIYVHREIIFNYIIYYFKWPSMCCYCYSPDPVRGIHKCPRG